MEIRKVDGKVVVEASPIKFEELDNTQKKLAQKFVDSLPHKRLTLTSLFDGIHGVILTFKIKQNTAGSTPRYDLSDLKKISKLKLRWIDFKKDEITIGI